LWNLPRSSHEFLPCPIHNSILYSGVAEPHRFEAAPAPRRTNEAAPAPGRTNEAVPALAQTPVLYLTKWNVYIIITHFDAGSGSGSGIVSSSLIYYSLSV
jgi:hypothetical protein